MAVTLRFADGTKHEYQTATTAYRHGGLIVVARDEEEIARFDAQRLQFAIFRNQRESLPR
jgi:hypothetical protein